MTLQQKLLSTLLPGHDPYAGFPFEQWCGTWYGDVAATRAIFRKAIEETRPGTIIEVGSFVGESTLFMAKQLQEIGLDAAIVCVDTWLGGLDHWTRVPEKLRFVHGRPSLYQQFLGNVMAQGLQHYIVPFNLDSSNSARLLTIHGIHGRLIFIDGSHEPGDVGRDLEAYWELLDPGGIMLVDDANGGFPGVTRDLELFKSSKRVAVEMEGEKAIIRKP